MNDSRLACAFAGVGFSGIKSARNKECARDVWKLATTSPSEAGDRTDTRLKSRPESTLVHICDEERPKRKTERKKRKYERGKHVCELWFQPSEKHFHECETEQSKVENKCDQSKRIDTLLKLRPESRLVQT